MAALGLNFIERSLGANSQVHAQLGNLACALPQIPTPLLRPLLILELNTYFETRYACVISLD